MTLQESFEIVFGSIDRIHISVYSEWSGRDPVGDSIDFYESSWNDRWDLSPWLLSCEVRQIVPDTFLHGYPLCLDVAVVATKPKPRTKKTRKDQPKK